MTRHLPLVALATLLAAPTALAQAGALDPSFGTGGRVTIDFGGPDPLDATDLARAVALQPDGKILVGGQDRSGAVVVRLLPDGSLDPAFGAGGRARVLTGDFDEVAWDVVVDPDGKIVACGSRLQSAEFGLTRLLPDGTPDVTFGDGGTALTGSVTGPAVACTRQPDGRYLVAGHNNGNGGTPGQAPAVARFLADGALDTTFGAGGAALVDLGGAEASFVAFDLLLQPDGRLLVAAANLIGLPGLGFVVARFLPDGAPDPDFGTGGVVTLPVRDVDQSYGLALDAEHRIVVVGAAATGAGDADVAVARLFPDGALDSTFGTEGVVVTALTAGDDGAFRVVVQPDGKLLLAAFSDTEGSDFTLLRYTESGALDPSFGADGIVTTDFSDGTDAAFDLALQPDGRIVAAGQSVLQSEDTDIAVARYLNDGGSVPTELSAEATTFTLSTPAPHPVRDAARLVLALDRPESVRVVVHDALGRTVAVLHDGPLPAGAHPLALDAARWPPGLYVARATTRAQAATRRLVVAQ